MELPVIQRIGNAWRTQRVAREYGMEPLARLLAEYLPQEQIQEVRRAYEFGAKEHKGQSRTSGEPYIFHPLAVARVLGEMHMDSTTLCAAILHDVIEDTGVSKDEVAARFGKDVAELVDGVSKIGKIEGMTRAERQAESFRKLLLAMTKDIRVILIKLADRLHNLRTLNAMAPEKRRRIARETLDIYAPIAQRLGIHTIRVELEDLAFAHLYPTRFAALAHGVAKQMGDAKGLVKEVESRLSQHLRDEGIGATVAGRDKNIYSIYQKMRRKKLRLLKVMDLLGFRVIVSKVDDCYRALGVVHHVFKPVPGHFDDYIANAKGNGYQSLHTSCVAPGGHKIEVQIRTREMHHVAEAGIAAHWQYKLGDRSSQAGPQGRAKEWLRNVFDDLGTDASMDFIEGVKVDLFPDEVYVFTPKGDIRQLPKGATPVDFAYSVHSELGDRCVAARIDGSLEPLNSPLKSGQTVEVITARHARPNAAWLHFVKTAKARSHIRNYLKNQREDEAIRLGRRLLEISLRDLRIPLSALREERAEQVLKSFALNDVEELFAAIGTGERLAPLVARRFLSETVGDASQPAGSGQALAIEGTEGLVLDYGRCCRPIPGDEIRGHVSVGRGIVIHRIECTHAKARPHDWVPLVWAQQVQGDFLCELMMQAQNKRGLLARITAEIAGSDASIENVQMPDRAGGDAVEMRFILTVKNRVHLARVMRRLRRIDGIGRVARS